MGYEIVRGPFILLETVEMLYGYINGISLRPQLNPSKLMEHSEEGNRIAQKIEQLRDIVADTCAGLDRQDSGLQRFFGQVQLDDSEESVCLARYLVYSFLTLSEKSYDGEVEQLRYVWRNLQKSGAWLSGFDSHTLIFSHDENSPGDLFEQVRRLKLPGDFRIELYSALRSFDRTLTELVELIRPVAQRLEQTICRATWILDETEQYWQQSPVSPLDFLYEGLNQSEMSLVGKESIVAIALMGSHSISYNLEHSPTNPEKCNFIFMGCSVTTTSVFRERDLSLEFLSATLKVLGDKKRLDILRRLSKNRAYGMELAESMGINQGNLSRSLSLLHSCGFVRQTRENLRTYYQADQEAFCDFMKQLEHIIFG